MRIKTVYLPGDEKSADVKPVQEPTYAPVKAGPKRRRIEFDPVPLPRVTGKLCAGCTQEWLRWLDYRSPRQMYYVAGGQTLVNDILDAQWAHYETWRRTVVTQQNLITTACLRDHRVAS